MTATPDTNTSEVARYVLDRLKSPEQGSDGQWWAFCPCHEDGKKSGRRSLSVTVREGKLLMHCFAGCRYQDISQALSLRKDAAGAKRRKKIEAVYDYMDEAGLLRLQVVRYLKPDGGKEFRQRQPDGNGDYTWNAKGVPPLLYRLPQVLASVKAGEIVFVGEGEKVVDRLAAAGLNATTNPGGAEKWRKQHAAFLKGARIVVLPDNDEPGEKHAQVVLKSLQGISQEVRLLKLPGLPVKGDVVDWLAAGHTKEELLELAAQAPIATVEISSEERNGKPGLDLSTTKGPVIRVDQGQLWQITGQGVKAVSANNNPPYLFQRSNSLVRLRRDTTGSSVIEVVGESAARGILARSAHWIRGTDDNVSDARPGLDIVRDFLALPEWPFPILESVTEMPIIREDGSVLDRSGYDSISRMMLCLPDGFSLPKIPSEPTQGHAKRAVSFILNELLADFPFQDEASRSNSFGLLVTLLVRPNLRGSVPLALIGSPQAGSGKSLLAEILSIAATGRTAAMTSAPEGTRGDDEEWRKKLLTLLLAGSNIVIIDNVEKPLRSPSLAAVLTSSVWTDRLLGHSKQISVPNRAVWIATGNNLRIEGDLPRRCFPINIDAKRPRPWERTEFKHTDLPVWVEKNRGDILAALLVMVRAWIVAGSPITSVPRIGGFDEWASTVGGILHYAGVEDFLGNLKGFYDEVNEDELAWMAFLEAWKHAFDDLSISASELTGHISEADDDRKVVSEEIRTLRESLPPFLAEALDRSQGSFKRVLGKALSKRAKMRFPNGLYIEKGHGDTNKKVSRWRICGVLSDSSQDVQLTDFTREQDIHAGFAGYYSPLTHGENEKNVNNATKEYREPCGDLGGIDPVNPANPADPGDPKINVTRQEGML